MPAVFRFLGLIVLSGALGAGSGLRAAEAVASEPTVPADPTPAVETEEDAPEAEKTPAPAPASEPVATPATTGDVAPAKPKPTAAELRAARAAKAAAMWPETRDRTFELVWRTVNESYYDPTFGGVDWTAVGEKYRARLPSVTDKAGLRRLLGDMLGELRRSHFAILPREMSVFTPKERSIAGGSGVEVAVVEGQPVVSRVLPGSAGERAGLQRGDVILKIGRTGLKPMIESMKDAPLSAARAGLYLASYVSQRLNGAVGRSVTLVARHGDEPPRDVKVTFARFEGEWSEPMGNFPSCPIVVDADVSADGVGYVKFNLFARGAMKGIRALLKRVPADGGLIIDLRGNPGGLTVMASGISGWLSDREFPLGTMALRDGHIGFTVTPQTGAFLGPIALLVDCGSVSTSEIMAAGLQEAGRARVFGEPTPGSALPSLFQSLPTDDLFQHAVADMQTPKGVLIEGRGVTPDEIVAPTVVAMVAGHDPAREAAEQWLRAQRPSRAAAGGSSP